MPQLDELVRPSRMANIAGILGSVDFAQKNRPRSCDPECGCDGYCSTNDCGKECQPDCSCDGDCDCYNYDPNCSNEEYPGICRCDGW